MSRVNALRRSLTFRVELLACLLFTLALIAPVPAQDPGFVDLFNGKNLDGWTQRNGTATYRVEGDSIVGKTSEGSPNSFLCTDKLYGDFELKFEVKVDTALNSGVQIRSQSVGGHTRRSRQRAAGRNLARRNGRLRLRRSGRRLDDARRGSQTPSIF